MILSSENDSIHSMAIVFKIWQYSMILPKYVYNPSLRKFEYRKDNRRILFSIVCFLLSLVGVYLKNVQRTNSELVLNWGYKLWTFLYTWTTIILVYRKSNEIEKLTENLIALKFEEENIFGRRIRRKLYELIWMIFITIIILIFISTEPVFIYYVHNTPKSIFFITLFYLNFFLNLLLPQFLITTLIIVYHHFRIINDPMEDLKISFRRSKCFANYCYMLRSTFTDLKNIFSLAIIMKCFHAFNTILKNILSVLVIDVYNDSILLQHVFQMFIFSWLSVEIIMICTLVWINAETEKQNNCLIAKTYEDGMKIGIQKLPYKNMELFLLDSIVNKVKFSVFGFFNLDWNLIYAMVAGLTTYSVYLIQFREMELSRKI